MTDRVSDLDFTHPIAVYGGPGGGVAVMRAATEPVPGENSYVSFARLTEAVPGLEAGLYLIRSRAVASYRGGWWASILLFAVSPDAEVAAGERAVTGDERFQALGEFEAVIDADLARQVQREYARQEPADAQSPVDDPSALWARNERGQVFPVRISDRPLPRFLPVLLVLEADVAEMPSSTVFYTAPFTPERPVPSAATAPVPVDVFLPKRGESESDLLAAVIGGQRRPFARLVIGSRSAVWNDVAHD